MLKSVTVLYVEDEVKLLDLLKSHFNKFFKNILVAKNGQEGLDLYKKHQNDIDIIITDINMPQLNGLEMIEQIKQIDSNIPVIITSAYNDAVNLQKAITLGVQNFVPKPVDLKELFSSIKKTLEPLLLKEEIEKQIIKNAKALASEKLAAGLTHELNTPLTYIKANFEMIEIDLEDLEESSTKKSIEQSISKINSGIKRIETIVNSIKELSLNNSEAYENTNIYETLINALAMSYNKTKHISKISINNENFNLDCSNNKYTFLSYGQKHRIEQLWVIIILNAMDELIKIEEFENRKLDIKITDENKYIKVVFKDNAGGIDESIINNIFEPFKGTKCSSGMGVGLSIAKKIINDQDGASIEAYNENNNAVFEIKLLKSKQ